MNKKFLRYILVLSAVSFIATVPAFASIVGSPHDFSGEVWSGGQICVVCHTPHNASTALTAPLWNHAVTAASFTVYSSPTLTAGAIAQPTAASKACLSCHDGTVAIDAFGGSAGTTGNTVTGHDLLGTDLSNDHPISFTYDTTLANNDGGLFDPATQTVSVLSNKTIRDGMLIGDKVECGSCHDVHKTKGYSPSSSKLLLVSNSGSGLCLTCHNK